MFYCVTGYHLFLQHSLQEALSSHYIRYSSLVLFTAFKMAHLVEPLTPFNYHQLKDDMVVMLHTKHLFKLIEEIEEEPESDKDKAKYMNRLDEAHGYLFSSVSRDLRFHIQGLKKNPKEIWDKLASLFDKQDEMRVHQLAENDLITLNPSNFESLNEFFTKFKNLIYQLKQFKVEKKDDQFTFAILSKLSVDYSVFVSSFQTMKLTTPNWKMPTLDAFIQSLTYENDKLIQMGIIRSPKDQALVARGGKVDNYKGKQRDESPVKKEQSNEPSC